MKNRFIILTASTLSLLSILIISDWPTSKDIENPAEHGDPVSLEKTPYSDVNISHDQSFNSAAGTNVKKPNVSYNTFNAAATKASGKSNEIGNEEAELIDRKIDSDESPTEASSWFGNPSDAEYHYISLFIESEMLSGYLLDSVVCMGNACKLSLLTTSYEQQSELKSNLINTLIQEKRTFNVEFNEDDDENELVLSITNG